MSVGTLATWICSEAGRPAAKVAHSDACQVDAGVWWEASILLCVGLPSGLLECPHSMTAGFTQNWQSTKPSKKLWGLLRSSLRSHTLWLPQHSTGHTGQLWFHVRGNCRTVWIPVGEDPWRPCWRLVTSVLLLFLWQLADYIRPVTVFQLSLWPSRVRKSQNYCKTTDPQSILSWWYECQQLKAGELRLLVTAGEGAFATLIRVHGNKQQQLEKDGFQKMDSSERKKVSMKVSGEQSMENVEITGGEGAHWKLRNRERVCEEGKASLKEFEAKQHTPKRLRHWQRCVRRKTLYPEHLSAAQGQEISKRTQKQSGTHTQPPQTWEERESIFLVRSACNQN